LKEKALNEKIKTKWAGRNLECHQTIGSTNDRAKELAAGKDAHGTLVIADSQTNGRGRRGKSWISEQGGNVYMSIIVKPQIPPEGASMLTLVAALAVLTGIEETTGIAMQIKWPNDIVANGCKVCGILTEMSGDTDAIHYVVIGMGINVNINNFDKEIQHKATSLSCLAGKRIDRGYVVASIMKHFEKYYEEFIRYKNLTPFLDEYNRKLVNRNCAVRVLAVGKEYTGMALGITAFGELIVQAKTGEIKYVLSGEVSVRGIYGYT